ncbi:MAG: hypothetical protein HC906_16580 [Bacteroidales bacterium]|nr:hypothetical protein [Bacteroidales bacterium]
MKNHVVITYAVLYELFGILTPPSFQISKNRWINRFLIATCLKSIQKNKEYWISVNGRIVKTLYIMGLSGNITGNLEVLISIVFRYVYRFLFKRGKE